MGAPMSGQEIYESFTRGDFSGLQTSGVATMRLSVSYADRAQRLDRLAAEMERAWQGDAADSARRGAGPLANRLALAIPQLGNAGRSIEQQAEEFLVAKNSVVPVPPVPEKPGFFDNVFSLGNAQGDYEKKLAAAQSANDNNVAVMTRYEDATRRNVDMLTQIPAAFASFPSLGDAHIHELPPSGAPIPETTTTGIPPAGQGGQPAADSAPAGEAASTSQSRAGNPSQSAAADAGLAGTRAESTGTAAASVAPLDIASPKQSLAPSLDGPRAGPPLGPVGVGYGLGADATRGGVPGGPREPGGLGGPRGAVARPVSDPGVRGRGPAWPESPAARGAGRAGTGRAGAGGPVGAGRRSESEDDLEHRRPAFLVEADPDELFGNDQTTAPPVIGG